MSSTHTTQLEVVGGTPGNAPITVSQHVSAVKAAGSELSGSDTPSNRSRWELQNLLRAFDCVNDRGMATAEYAIATLAAAGFAGLLITVLRSDQVKEFLLKIIESALTVA